MNAQINSSLRAEAATDQVPDFQERYGDVFFLQPSVNKAGECCRSPAAVRDNPVQYPWIVQVLDQPFGEVKLNFGQYRRCVSVIRQRGPLALIVISRMIEQAKSNRRVIIWTWDDPESF